MSFQKFPTAQDKNPPERVYYSESDEDEANTVSFIDLDSHTPKVQSNGGQATLTVVEESEQSVMLLNHREGANAGELYTIFKTTGIVIYSQQQYASLIGPFGVLEMGYCN